MKALSECMDEQMKKLNETEKKVTLQVKWNLLYKVRECNTIPEQK